MRALPAGAGEMSICFRHYHHTSLYHSCAGPVHSRRGSFWITFGLVSKPDFPARTDEICLGGHGPHFPPPWPRRSGPGSRTAPRPAFPPWPPVSPSCDGPGSRTHADARSGVPISWVLSATSLRSFDSATWTLRMEAFSPRCSCISWAVAGLPMSSSANTARSERVVAPPDQFPPPLPHPPVPSDPVLVLLGFKTPSLQPV